MTNEAILMQKMLSEASSAGERAYLLSSYLDEFRGVSTVRLHLQTLRLAPTQKWKPEKR